MELITYIQPYVDQVVSVVTEYGPGVIGALIVLLLGLRLTEVVVRFIENTLIRAKVDETLKPFLISSIRIILKILVFVTVASMLGVETTSLVALIGAAGLAVGLALQGSLSNFAGGALILLFRPYIVGDYIEINGHFGKVKGVHIFNTFMITNTGKTVILPNGDVSNGTIINYSKEGHIRCDMQIGVGYNSDLKKVKEILTTVLESNSKVLKTPRIEVGVQELADSAIIMTLRPWCKPGDYWRLQLEALEEAKIALDKEGVVIPFPQRDIHIYNK